VRKEDLLSWVCARACVCVCVYVYVCVVWVHASEASVLMSSIIILVEHVRVFPSILFSLVFVLSLSFSTLALAYRTAGGGFRSTTRPTRRQRNWSQSGSTSSFGFSGFSPATASCMFALWTGKASTVFFTLTPAVPRMR
jgi:hypothetical protein